jgi:hypothetical protein
MDHLGRQFNDLFLGAAEGQFTDDKENAHRSFGPLSNRWQQLCPTLGGDRRSVMPTPLRSSGHFFPSCAASGFLGATMSVETLVRQLDDGGCRNNDDSFIDEAFQQSEQMAAAKIDFANFGKVDFHFLVAAQRIENHVLDLFGKSKSHFGVENEAKAGLADSECIGHLFFLLRRGFGVVALTVVSSFGPSCQSLLYVTNTPLSA